VPFQGAPFPDYFLPGLTLLVILGVLPLLVSWGLWKRRGWAWPAGLAIGVALLV